MMIPSSRLRCYHFKLSDSWRPSRFQMCQNRIDPGNQIQQVCPAINNLDQLAVARLTIVTLRAQVRHPGWILPVGGSIPFEKY